MDKCKSVLVALIISLGVVVSCYLSLTIYTNYKKSSVSSIQATGSAEMSFESDLIVWTGTFRRKGDTIKDVYTYIKKDADIVKEYLEKNGINNDEMVFNSVDIFEDEESMYDNDGKFLGNKFIGYKLQQQVVVTSTDIDKVEKVSRDISSLLETGVNFSSVSPSYHCTTLGNKKLELIKNATINAKERIEILAKEANAKIGKLKNSKLGVFQIVAKNSGTESYAYDGYLDSTSRLKTATITVKLEYEIE